MQNRIWIVILLTIIGLFFGSNPALAVDIPNFPTCSNPQGTIKVSYSDGTHGIVGDNAQYTGSDTVYQLDNGNLAQCFCSTNGAGIQTNWWKDSSLSEEERQILINSGWIYIPNGALWGLESTAYMTYNSTYSCQANTGGGGGGGSGGPGDGRSDGLGCGSHDCSGNAAASEGQVLGVSTSIGEVLGLASTGGAFLPYALAIAGFLFLTTGLFLSKKSSQG